MDDPHCTIIYLVNGERYRDATSLQSFLGPRLQEIKDARFQAWLERNDRNEIKGEEIRIDA